MKIFTIATLAALMILGCRTKSSEPQSRNKSLVSPKRQNSAPSTGPSEFERYEQSKEYEENQVRALVKLFGRAMQLNSRDGKIYRGTHAKGTCAAGRLEIFGLDDPKYRVGLFKEPRVFENVRARFANGKGKYQPDGAPDARALSISVDLGNGKKQDFSMNNHPIFPIQSLRSFNLLMGMTNKQIEFVKRAKPGSNRLAIEALEEEGKDYFLKGAKADEKLGLLAVKAYGEQLTNQQVTSYRNLKYWSGSAFKYGAKNVAKFALEACDKSAPNPLPNKKDPLHLQKDLINWVGQPGKAPGNDICFHFQVQLLDASRMNAPRRFTVSEFSIPDSVRVNIPKSWDFNGRMRGLIDRATSWTIDQKLEPWQWVEDVTLNWDKAFERGGDPTKGFVTVGKLTIKRNSIFTPEECDDPKNAFNTTINSLPMHKGLGRINRGRYQVEAMSKNKR